MMQSIEKLREMMDYVREPGCNKDVPGAVWVRIDTMQQYADEIEAEIAERYMELPLDADDAPIHVGDEMESDNERFVVCAVAPGRVHRWHIHNIGELDKGTVAYPPGSLHHFKPLTLDDVLQDLIDAAAEIHAHALDDDMPDELDSLIGEYADKVREAVGE